MKKKLLAVLALAILLAFSIAPGAWAAEPDTSELIKLDTPTNPHWGYDGPTGDIKGVMSWSPGELHQGNFRASIYRRDGENSVLVTDNSGLRGATNANADAVIYSPTFWTDIDNFESGTYYFTIKAEGDGTKYTDSDEAVSPDFIYTKPDKNIAVEYGNLHWEGSTACWEINNPSGTFNNGCVIEFYFSATENEEPKKENWIIFYHFTENKHGILDDIIQENGVGYYYFKVRALSSDINAYGHAEWSELSPAYKVTEIVESVDDKLDNILANEGNTGSAVNEAVQQLDRDELKTSMLADTDNSGTVSKLAALENKTNIGLNINVAGDFDGFPSEGVDVVGARLNDLNADTREVTLEVGKPKQPHDTLPAQYDNTVAVSFSMDLTGVQDTENLKVPVKITLPVPKNINPDFLAILHYKANGEIENLNYSDYTIFQKNGKNYVTFVLTSFSDFVITQLAGEDPAEIPVASVTLDKIALTLEVKTGEQLTATVLPEKATNKTVTWSSSDEKVAAVDSTGKVTAVGKGTATIIASAGDKKAECLVTVTADTVYAITFDTDGGTLVGATSPDYVTKGAEYKMPSATKSRYTFQHWAIGAKNSTNTVKANEVYTFTADTTVYAIWQYNGGGGHSSRPGSGGTTTPVKPEKPGTTNPGTPGTSSNTVTGANINNVFADVKNNAWYAEAIAYVYNKGIMNGTGNGQFEPNSPTTRAMLVTMLYRLEKEPGAGAINFGDVASGQWYSQAIAWAADNGIVKGYSDTQFAPNDEITREQLAVILYRYAQFKGLDVTAKGDLSSFRDSQNVSDYP